MAHVAFYRYATASVELAVIVLAAVGIYGVVSYAGSLRREEMATRLALGASPRSVFLLVIKQGAILGLVRSGFGIALAYFSGQRISSRAYALCVSYPLCLGVSAAVYNNIVGRSA